MTDFKLTSLDVLAEAALLYSGGDNNEDNQNSQENSNDNYAMLPKKRFLNKYYQNNLNTQANERLNSNSSGYSSTTNESSKSPDYLSSSSERESFSLSNSPPTNFEETTPKSNKILTNSTAVNLSNVKRYSTKKSAKKLSKNLSIEEQKGYLNEFANKVSIKPKIENDNKQLNDLNDDVFDDENVKIEVKTPKLTYTLRGMRKRKASTKTPDFMKDEEYYAKRERNNLAAKKSRNNKYQAIRTSELKLKQLENEREELDLQLGKEIMIMKLIQDKMSEDSHLKQRLLDLVEDRQLDYFKKVLELN